MASLYPVHLSPQVLQLGVTYSSAIFSRGSLGAFLTDITLEKRKAAALGATSEPLYQLSPILLEL